MTLTKAALTEHLTDELGLNKREGKEVVESFFTEINNTLVAGEEVKLTGFGNFSVHDKKERPGRNPKTGEEVIIQARRVVTFKAGQKLKFRVEEYGARVAS
ncbi:MAG: integration host factor subunit alpha [Woeseiaceae bacterium]